MKIINIDLFNQYNADLFDLINYFTKSEKRTKDVMVNLKNYIEDGSAIVGGHVDNNQLISFIWCHERMFGGQSRLHIAYFIVSEFYRGQGLSRDLIEFAKDQALKNGIYKVDLNVEPENKRAIEMYHKSGFKTEKLQLIMDLTEVDKDV